MRLGAVGVAAACAASACVLPASAHRRTARARAVARAVTVTVTAARPTEFEFTLSASRVRRGRVVFEVRNAGKLAHDFEIAGRRTRVLLPGRSQRLVVTFRKPGRYSYFCSVPGHAAVGMRGILRVT